jgi:hypothetical protein
MTTIDTLQLDNLLWLNGNEQQRVATSLKRALNGAPHIQQAIIPAGHKMELGTKDGWLSRTQFQALQQHSFTQLGNFALNHNGQLYQVVWDHSSGAAVTGQDVFDDVAGDAFLTNVKLIFLTV